MMRRMGWLGLAAAFLFTPVMAKSADLQEAFKAAFGRAPPMMRRVNLTTWGQTTLRLNPLRLVHIGGAHFALVISESFDGAHVAEGDVAVAYLDRDQAGWRPIRVWYEFLQTGSSGTPFPRHKVWSFNFGGSPFFAGESLYCGMGACTRWYDLIGLNSDGPSAWGHIDASGSFEPIGDPIPDSDGMIGCGGYEYSSVISAPRTNGALMRVTYTGSMTPGGNGQSRHDVRVSTEVFLAHGRLTLRPEATMPNCGQ